VAYEVRQQRRESRNRRLASASTADTATMSTDTNEGLVYGSSYTNSRQMTAAGQAPANAALTAVAGEPPVGSVKVKGKAEHLYSAMHGIQTTLKRSGMDHTVLPAINTMPAFTS